MPGTLQDYAQAVHDVIVINRDAEQSYRGAAQAINDLQLKTIFGQYAEQRAGFAREMQTAVKALGFEPIDPQGLGGILRASWMSVKGMATGHDSHSILVEVERAEDSSLNTYRMALTKTLTPEIASIMERQFAEIQAVHDRIKLLREATAPPDEVDTPKQPATPSGTASGTNSDVPKGI